TRNLPSGEKATAESESRCPVRRRISLPVAVSHKPTSSPARARILPSGENAAETTRGSGSTCTTLAVATSQSQTTLWLLTLRTSARFRFGENRASQPLARSRRSLAFHSVMVLPPVRSHKRTGPSYEPNATRLPSGEKPTAFRWGKSKWRIFAPVATSQNRTADAMVLPSGEKTSEDPTPPYPSFSARSCSPVSTSHTRIVLSLFSPPETRYLPSGENAIASMMPTCPLNCRMALPVAASHNHKSPRDPEATYFPCGETATEVTPWTCPGRALISLPVGSSHWRIRQSLVAAMVVPSGVKTMPRTRPGFLARV